MRNDTDISHKYISLKYIFQLYSQFFLLDFYRKILTYCSFNVSSLTAASHSHCFPPRSKITLENIFLAGRIADSFLYFFILKANRKQEV